MIHDSRFTYTHWVEIRIFCSVFTALCIDVIQEVIAKGSKGSDMHVVCSVAAGRGGAREGGCPVRHFAGDGIEGAKIRNFGVCIAMC